MRMPRRSDWDKLSASERRFLAFGGALAAVIVLASFLYSGNQAIQKGGSALRDSRQRLAVMESMAHELRRLPDAAASGRANMEELRGIVTESLQRTLAPASMDVRVGGETSVSAKISGVGFDKMIAWLDDMCREQHLRVESAKIRAGTATGLVEAEIRLGSGT